MIRRLAETDNVTILFMRITISGTKILEYAQVRSEWIFYITYFISFFSIADRASLYISNAVWSTPFV